MYFINWIKININAWRKQLLLDLTSWGSIQKIKNVWYRRKIWPSNLLEKWPQGQNQWYMMNPLVLNKYYLKFIYIYRKRKNWSSTLSSFILNMNYPTRTSNPVYIAMKSPISFMWVNFQFGKTISRNIIFNLWYRFYLVVYKILHIP